MRNLVISLLAVALLGTGTSFAQSGTWVGVSSGFPRGELHFGVASPFVPGIDLRINGGYAYAVSAGFAVGADALVRLDTDVLSSLRLDPYLGFGFVVSSGTPIDVFVNTFGGLERRLDDLGLPGASVFLEIGPSVEVVDVFAPGFLGVFTRFGFNWRL